MTTISKSNKKILIAVFCLFALVGAGFFCFFLLTKTPVAKAGTAQNVSGWAWSENIGWVSFNSVDCDSNDDGKSDGLPGCPATGTPIASYGVNVAKDGLFSGYAWSENVGWISFNPGDLAGCPSAPCEATLNLATKQASGWARALSSGGGWDGWLSLRGGNYGVSFNPLTQELEGWAWGSEVVGWLSFNCKDSGNCLTSNYKVLVSSPPKATDLLVSQGDYCTSSSALRPIFSWTFSDPDPGDAQGAYQIQVDNNNDFLSSEIISSKIFSSSTAYSPISSFDFNTTYWWRIRVWDNNDVTSTDWIYPTSTPGFPTAKPGAPFETPVHAYPQPNFEWLPKVPSQGEFIQFCATNPAEGVCSTTVNVSKCYDETQKKISCSGNEFLWVFPNETSTTTENPRVKFPLKGKLQPVSLQITDALGVCTTTKTINISSPLPKWQEIPPQ